MPITSETLKRLAQFDTPTICNVLELFDVMPRTAGYMDARIKACYPALPPMVGFAATATFRAAAPPRAGDIYAGLARQVEQLAATAAPKVVVFQDLDDPPVAATFGEVMCTTYQAFGCVGLITSGAGRDLDQVEALKFPCFTAGTICSHGYTQIVELGGPVRVGLVIAGVVVERAHNPAFARRVGSRWPGGPVLVALAGLATAGPLAAVRLRPPAPHR